MTIYKRPAKTMRELKRRVINLLKQGWTRGTLYRDADGYSVLPEEATTMCLVGASYAANAHRQNDLLGRLMLGLEDRIKKDGNAFSIASFNDNIAHNVEDVIDLVKRTKSVRSA